MSDAIRVERLDEPAYVGGDDVWYAEDASRPGCWATGSTEAVARAELAEVVEEWEQVRRTYA